MIAERKILISKIVKMLILCAFGAALCSFYIQLRDAPLKRVTEDDISYMEMKGPEISYVVDLHNSSTGQQIGSVADIVYFDPRLNFDLFFVPCDKELGDLCEEPVHIFWARYIHQKSPVPLRSSQYFTEEGRGHLPPNHAFFKKMKKKVLEHFCRRTEFCLKEKYDGLGLKIPYFDLD